MGLLRTRQRLRKSFTPDLFDHSTLGLERSSVEPATRDGGGQTGLHVAQIPARFAAERRSEFLAVDRVSAVSLAMAAAAQADLDREALGVGVEGLHLGEAVAVLGGGVE